MSKHDCEACIHKVVCALWEIHNELCDSECAYYQPTLTPPNEPLTLEQLREMDGEPVWFDTIKRWGIVRVCGYGISVLTKSGEYDVTRMKFYRRPPEGEVDGK